MLGKEDEMVQATYCVEEVNTSSGGVQDNIHV